MIFATLLGSMTYGLVSSLHCALMCGPVAITAAPAGESRWRPTAAYHLSRGLAYLVLGAFLGGVGGTIQRVIGVEVGKAMPYLLAAALIAAAFDLMRYLPAPRFLKQTVGRAWAAARGASPITRAGLIGAATVLLPCGVLYGIGAAAAASGSAADGATLFGGFALGSVPALVAMQLPAGALLRKLPPSTLVWGQRAVAVVAAVLLVGRAVLRAMDPGSSCH